MDGADGASPFVLLYTTTQCWEPESSILVYYSESVRPHYYRYCCRGQVETPLLPLLLLLLVLGWIIVLQREHRLHLPNCHNNFLLLSSSAVSRFAISVTSCAQGESAKKVLKEPSPQHYYYHHPLVKKSAGFSVDTSCGHVITYHGGDSKDYCVKDKVASPYGNQSCQIYYYYYCSGLLGCPVIVANSNIIECEQLREKTRDEFCC